MTRDGIVASAIAGVLTLVLIWAFVQLQAEHDRWVAWCAGVGGHVISDSDTATGVGYAVGNGPSGSGGVVVTTTTTTDYYCLSETGGILDIR